MCVCFSMLACVTMYVWPEGGSRLVTLKFWWEKKERGTFESIGSGEGKRGRIKTVGGQGKEGGGHGGEGGYKRRGYNPASARQASNCRTFRSSCTHVALLEQTHNKFVLCSCCFL
jgi:hypothetical protein